VISLTDIFDAASRRHNVILLPAICRVSGKDFVRADQCTSTPRQACATVELMRQEMPKFLACDLWPDKKCQKFLAFDLWPPNSSDLSPMDYEIWAVMQHRV